MKYFFRGRTHPSADGRQAEDGETAFVLYIGLEENAMLTVELGDDDFTHVAATMLAMLADEPKLHAEARRLSRQLIKKRAK